MSRRWRRRKSRDAAPLGEEDAMSRRRQDAAPLKVKTGNGKEKKENPIRRRQYLMLTDQHIPFSHLRKKIMMS